MHVDIYIVFVYFDFFFILIVIINNSKVNIPAYAQEFLSVQFSLTLCNPIWTAARQVSLSITNSRNLLKLMSIESVMPSNHLILCHPLSYCLQSFPGSGSFQMSQFFASGSQSIGISASASVLPKSKGLPKKSFQIRTDFL